MPWGPRRVTYLMVLDGEKDEALAVLLEDGLLDLIGLDARSHGRLGLLLLGSLHAELLRVLGVDLGLEGGEISVKGLVLLVGGSEVELLDRGFHLEGLNGRCSLWGKDAY